MSLIDADVLKKDLKSYFTNSVLDYISAKLAFNRILNVIDNATPVEQELHITGAQWDKFMKEYKRPQGEWKLHGMIYYCSVCGHECGESGDNFCGNCGADMRKEVEDGRV